jgi:phosphoribosylformylglycinamidine cyclo-ligase
MVLVVPAANFQKLQKALDRAGEKYHTIGRIVKGDRKVQYA